MEKFASMAFVGVIAVALLMECAAAQTVHVVGDSMGWSIPTSGGAGAYNNWAATKNFVVGDVLSKCDIHIFSIFIIVSINFVLFRCFRNPCYANETN